MTEFVPGLALNRLFHAQVVQPLLAARFPTVPYSAGLIGYGSDVLGYDTERSTDHEWGPRLLLFLSDEDYEQHHEALRQTFRRELPPTFHGYPTNFTAPNPLDAGVRLLEPGISGQINHHIAVMTIGGFLESALGISTADALSARDWLTFPEQKLLEVTGGAIYHDGLGMLMPLREQLAYYPHDVWLYRLASQWQRISEEEAFVGRCAEVGDDLGSRVVAARLVREVMRLCFLIERRYAPYSKWLGTAFTRLESAAQVMPHLAGALSAPDIAEREQHLAATYEAVARMQNALAIAEWQDPASRLYHDRPLRVIHAERFAAALSAAMRDEELRRIADHVGLVGAVDQFVDCTDVLSRADSCRRLATFYD